MISNRLAPLARWLPWREGPIDRLFAFTPLSAEEPVQVILTGISSAGASMESKVLFALAKRIVPAVSQSEARTYSTGISVAWKSRYV